MIIKVKGSPVATLQSDAQAALRRLQELQKPIKLISYLEKFSNEREINSNIFRCLATLREAFGKAAAIQNDLLLATTVRVNMNAKATTCVFDDNNIYLSYDLFTLENIERTKEEVIKAIAGLISDKVYGAHAKRFHSQLILYLLGYDPMREIEEKAASTKALNAI